MSCVTGNCNESLTLDPYKRVCYSRGLVLGVDEFVQEELYFLEQHRWHNRGLHGYGTVCGLNVEARDTAGEGPEVFVSPGMALDPKGRRIRVGAAQCARLNEWLARFGEELGSPPGFGSPPLVTLFLRLCYRECSTDRVPIPSGPCRSAEETSVPSRVLDDFRLELTTTPPDQTEVDIVRAFARMLRAIEFSAAEPPTLTREALEDLVRALLPQGSPPGEPPMPGGGSPPEVWRIDPADAEEYLRAAFRVWVTEVRPALLADGGACAGGPPAEGCILLARIEFPVAEGLAGLVVAGDAGVVAVVADDRPYLLHTQLLQELFLGGAFVAGQGGGATEHALLTGLDADDHAQYLLVEPATRALIADLDAAGNRVRALADGAAIGDAMPVGQPIPAASDLAGVLPGPRVVRIQGRDVLDQNPGNANVLTWVQANNRWEPRPIPAVPPPPPPVPPTNFEERLVRIFALSWRHNRPHDFVFRLDGREVFGLAVAFGVEQAGDARVRIGLEDSAAGRRQDAGSLDEMSFQVFAEPAAGSLLSRRRLGSGKLVPIVPNAAPGSPLFNEGATLPGTFPPGSPPLAPGALLVFERGDLADIENTRVYVELNGDVVLDDGATTGEPRAIDAEFARAELPTGDRPNGSRIGLQGGRFSSWFGFRRGQEGPPFDFRFVTRDQLTAGGVPAPLAEAILAFRDAQGGAIRDIGDLRAIPGIGAARIEQLRRLLFVSQ